MKNSLDFKDLGDKHKKFEGLSESNLIPWIPVIARLDGRAFHTLTRDLEKPFDIEFIKLMEDTAKSLLHEFNADIVYVQSDEITLAWESLDMFDGRVQKLCSSLAGYASAYFSSNYDKLGTFDCRIWQVPNLEIITENIMWREMDAAKNSVNMVAHAHFKQSELDGLNTKQRIAKLETIGYYWNKLPDYLKRGSIFVKQDVIKYLTEEELKNIPEEHHPKGPISRRIIVRKDIDQLTKVVNKVDVLFYNNVPVYFNIVGEEEND